MENYCKDLKLLVNDMRVIPAKGTVCSSNDVLDESTKHIEDNNDLTLTFGDISAIPNPNDTTLIRENVDKLHSTAIHPDELTVQNDADVCAYIMYERRLPAVLPDWAPYLGKNIKSGKFTYIHLY
ncbi:unnamed protein product [Acanthoscelides obtectus]|uniref:Uncharacterized protein n=1 Tax=Acanthoscelides obtectus TaxID=200917 RepID=A0A9P0M9V0_ACAOB|nr:unnamed protein product [Acanthoscelides obtectus]CAK1682390.1 hypothetical protein AOBTE_LOCUS33596 [Acanthoscelides obtectus]